MRLAMLLVLLSSTAALAQAGPDTLRGPSAFDSIADPAARSRAIFMEAAKVVTSPRCMNCHPAGEHPTQGNAMHVHLPPVSRNVGSCQGCHTDSNYTLMERATYESIPGHPPWDLAPAEMAWQGKSIGEICRQLKDPNRNGGRNLSLLHEHAAHDDLVAWGWKPGAGRETAPGSQQIFGELIQGWIDTGAEESVWTERGRIAPSA